MASYSLNSRYIHNFIINNMLFYNNFSNCKTVCKFINSAHVSAALNNIASFMHSRRTAQSCMHALIVVYTVQRDHLHAELRTY